MDKIVMFRTFDGKTHESKRIAERHIEKEYANLLSKMVHGLTPLNFQDKFNYIDEHLADFIQLKRMKDDLQLSEDEDD